MPVYGYESASTTRVAPRHQRPGIEAQRQAIEGFVASRGGTPIARFTEVESSRNPDRPDL